MLDQVGGVKAYEIDAAELAQRMPLLAGYSGSAVLDHLGGPAVTTDANFKISTPWTVEADSGCPNQHHHDPRQRARCVEAGVPPVASTWRPNVEGIVGKQLGAEMVYRGLAACREGDTLVVTKLDRLARSVPDARDIVDELTNRGVRLNIGGSVHDPPTRLAGCCSPCCR